MKTRNYFKRTLFWICLAAISLTKGYSQVKVVAYVPNWIDLNSFAYTISYDKLTHINIAFENIADASGNLSFSSANNVLIQQAKAHNVKVLISIGGGGIENNTTLLGWYSNLLKDANRAAFIQKISNYISSHNLDGIDVDLEGSAIDDNYGKFITDLANKLRPQGKIISAALGSTWWAGGDRVPSSAIPYFDYINIMAYDLTGPWSSPGQHSPYSFAESSLNYWLGRGLPASKAILGVPFYGYGFNDLYNTDGYTYTQIVTNYPGAENSDQVGNVIYYNGISTIKQKATLGKNSGGGVMIWELSQDINDSRSLLAAIDQVIKGGSNSSNLALNKTAIASSVETSAFTASLAFDGNSGSRWASLYSDPQWIYVDLGASYTINRVKLNWEAAYGRNYQIQVSSNASSWTTVYSTTSGDGGIDDISFTSANARYVRMYGTARATSWGYSLWDFEVYAGTSGNTPPIGSWITLKGNNGLYVTSNNGASPITCNIAVAQDWEKFQVVDAGNGLIALKGNNGLYVSSENGAITGMNCTRSSIQGWEMFTWIGNGTTVQLKGNNGNYVCQWANGNGTGPVACNRSVASSWETFTWATTTKSGNVDMEPGNATDGVCEVFPNPATELLYVKTGSGTGSIIKIFNLDGRLAYTAKTNEMIHQVNVKNLKLKGMILIQVASNNRISTIKAIVK